MHTKHSQNKTRWKKIPNTLFVVKQCCFIPALVTVGVVICFSTGTNFKFRQVFLLKIMYTETVKDWLSLWEGKNGFQVEVKVTHWIFLLHQEVDFGLSNPTTKTGFLIVCHLKALLQFVQTLLVLFYFWVYRAVTTADDLSSPCELLRPCFVIRTGVFNLSAWY